MADTININQMLVEMKAGYGSTSRIEFVYGSGKRRGQLGCIERAIYGRPNPSKRTKKVKEAEAEHRKRASQLDAKHPLDRPMVRQGTIPLTDMDKEEYRQLLISHVIGYNHMQVLH